MKKYEIYLPLKYNDGREIEAEKIKQIPEDRSAATMKTIRKPPKGTSISHNAIAGKKMLALFWTPL